MTVETAIYAITQQGTILAGKLAAAMEADIYAPSSLGVFPLTGKSAPRHSKTYGSLMGLVAKTFRAYRNHVFIATAGVVVRAIAPHLLNKRPDPAVVVLDHKGKHVVSLFSGQLDGANELGRSVAALIGAKPIITSAKETESLPSIDLLALELGLGFRYFKPAASIKKALIDGQTVLVNDPHNHLQLRHSPWEHLFEFSDKKNAKKPQDREGDDVPPPRITVTPFLAEPSDQHLVLYPRVLHVGLDCRRGVRTEEILQLLATALAQLGLASEAIASVVSTDNMQFEQGILQAAEKLEAPARFFSFKECNTVNAPSSPPNARLQKAEAPEIFATKSALLAAGPNAILRVPQLMERGVTIAIAEETPQER